MELVAKPMPNAMDDSTPRNLATSSSSSSWMSRFPGGRQRLSVSVSPAPRAKLSARELRFHRPESCAKT